MAGQPGAATARNRRGNDQLRRPAGSRHSPLDRARSFALDRPRCTRRRKYLGIPLERIRVCSARTCCRRRSTHRHRSESLVPESRSRSSDVRARCATSRAGDWRRAKCGARVAAGVGKDEPNTDRLVDLCGVAVASGADALVLANTVLGLRIDTASRRAVLGNGGGGVSGTAIHAVAVRCVFDVHRAHPQVPIVGVGGVSCANDAIELMMAGASAVQVGTATFATRARPRRFSERCCVGRGVTRRFVGRGHGQRTLNFFYGSDAKRA